MSLVINVNIIEFTFAIFFLSQRLSLSECAKIPVLVLADSQIQSSPFTCLLTVCRVFYLRTRRYGWVMWHREERAGDYMEENAELLSQVVARRD